MTHCLVFKFHIIVWYFDVLTKNLSCNTGNTAKALMLSSWPFKVNSHLTENLVKSHSLMVLSSEALTNNPFGSTTKALIGPSWPCKLCLYFTGKLFKSHNL